MKLAQLDFEIGQETYRISVQDKAAPPKAPSNNKRIKYMAVAPVGILFVMLGLFLLVEIKAERVGDPDALSTRVQSEVYALPPLPTVRRSASGARRTRTTRSSNSSSGWTTCGSRSAATRPSWRRGVAC